MSMLRVFTAVKLPASSVKKIVSVCSKYHSDSELRFVEPAGLHITLNFVGDVEDRETPILCKEFQNAILDIPDFSIQIQGLGAFPNMDRPRVLWIGITEGNEILCQINQKLRDVIEDFGFVQEKRYAPHITIARTKKRQIDDAVLNGLNRSIDRLEFESFQAREVIVFNSILEKDGPTYIPLATMPLEN